MSKKYKVSIRKKGTGTWDLFRVCHSAKQAFEIATAMKSPDVEARTTEMVQLIENGKRVWKPLDVYIV